MRMMTKGGLLFVAAALVVAIGVGAWNAFRTAKPGEAPAPLEAAAAPAAATPTVATVDPETLRPVIAPGRRDLGDSVYAVRDGNQVTVYFDTELLRTRFDWKFEGVVRATLPLVFGEDVRTALDSIPAGTFASTGDLVTQLPERGIPLKVGEHTLRVYPVVRPGRDGPLVYAYRASVSRCRQRHMRMWRMT
jgi:hypothetical protein